MGSNGNFTTDLVLSSPFATTTVLSVPTPSAIVTSIGISTDVYNVTIHPSVVDTTVTLSNDVIGITIHTAISVPSQTSVVASSLSPTVPAALGAVLGVLAILSTVIIALLLRKNRRLLRDAQQANGSAAIAAGQNDYHYPLYGKEVISNEETPEQLKRQLGDVRRELAAMTVLAPSSIRDQSDYIRDLTLLNDTIRQLSMRINRVRPDISAARVRSALCAALWTCIFTRFDAGLDGKIDQQMIWIGARFEKKSTAILWKALTVHPLPMADTAAVATSVEYSLSASSIEGFQPKATSDVVQQGLKLSRALAEDGKGFAVSYVRDGERFDLLDTGTLPSV